MTRYLPHTEQEIQEMFASIGVNKIEELFDTIPDDIKFKGPLNLSAPYSEIDLRKYFSELAQKNQSTDKMISFLGAGAYNHYVPSVISQLINRGEFLTTYTPYQPEVSQGTLQALFEYQTMICELTGMEVANGSNYDVSTACAEALLMAFRINKKKTALISKALHPQYKQVLHSYLDRFGFNLIEVNYQEDGMIDQDDLNDKLNDDVGAVLIQSPNYFGVIEDIKTLGKNLDSHEALFITAMSEAIAASVLTTPGEANADIAVMEAQSFGVGLNFGGPYLGAFACKQKYIRQMPGRIVGQTEDTEGKLGYVLTFATREQHIRREKATSNICTNQGLCTLMASIYLSLMGKEGLVELAGINFSRSEYTKEKFSSIKNVELKFSGSTFNEFVLTVPNAKQVIEKLKSSQINLGMNLASDFSEIENGILVCITEMNSKDDIDEVAQKLDEIVNLR